MYAFIRVILSNVLLFSGVCLCCSGLAFAKIALNKIKLPFPQNVKQVPGLEYHGVSQAFDTISNLPILTYSATVHFQKNEHKIISVPIVLTRNLANVINPENIDSKVEEAMFSAVDTLSKYRDPLTTMLLLTNWSHFADVEEGRVAELHQRRYDSPVEHEFFYKKLASYHRTVLDALLYSDEFRTEFGNEGLIHRATQHPDKGLAEFRNLLDAQLVPIKDSLLGRLRIRLKALPISRKLNKLPEIWQQDFVDVINSYQSKDEVIDVMLHRAYLRKLHSAINTTIADKLPPSYQQPTGITAEELKKFADLDQQLWNQLYIFQKNIVESGFNINIITETSK